MSLPEDFLTQLEQYKELSQREREVFLRLLGKGMSRQKIAQDLSIGESNLSTCLTGIYRKFSIRSDLGRGKENHLREYLTQRYSHGKGVGFSISESLNWDIDTLVQEARRRVQLYIKERCGTMRVLDMTQPIGLDDIYTNVNILEKITGRKGLELSELIRNTEPEKFERFCLGSVREQRVPGLEAVEKFSKLMILGKPGAGKTTFLKHLAIQCIGDRFQPNRVPLFITLKDFAEADGQPNLLEYISRLIAINPVEARHTVPLPTILSAGRALILLDGLDEVRDTDSSRVLQQIKEFSQLFPQNQFVITCRIAAREYTFERFTEVEIADFDDTQIADFSGKWFRSKNDLIKAEQFLQKLKEDEPIRELATNPLLLTLLCLVFEDTGSFPINRAELYQTGVEVLLKKWDVKRNIEREQVYKRLSLKRKEDLLSQIARTTFEAGNYFFKQREVERYISQYIQNLPDASTDSEVLELDSTAVLKSIEAQHGLFVERARGIYSFSHLTFHEYFTARKIVTSCNPYTADDPTLQGLVSQLTEKRWREVFLLTVGMLDSSDTFLRLMKAQIDQLLAEDEKLQMFLRWVDEKARLVETWCEPTAKRALFLTIEKALFPMLYSKLSFHLDLTLPLSLHHDLALYFSLDIDLSVELSRIWSYVYRHSREYSITIPYNGSINLTQNNLPLEFPLPSNINYELQKELENLKEQFHLLQVDLNTRYQYEYENVQILAEQLRAVMIKYRNIGHDWQFSEEQEKLLQLYYDANKLLVDCLNSDCYVSREVRQEIEETLLLPIAEIEKRQQQVL